MMNKLGASKFVEFGSVGLALLSLVMVVTVSSVPAKSTRPRGLAREAGGDSYLV
jgi:hypothetical protein